MLYIRHTPFIIISLVLSLRPTICTQSHANLMATFLLTAHLLLRVNSVMNAIIFLIGNRKSRQLILEVFSRACNRTAITVSKGYFSLDDFYASAASNGQNSKE